MSVVKVEQPELVYRAAAVARLAVNVEMAYDVVDELARTPERYHELLGRISRVVSKVLRDVEKALEEAKEENDRKVLKMAYKLLLQWPKLLEELFAKLESEGEAARAVLVKKFAALTVAPDRLTVKVAKILERV
jgi:CRISPR-associated protein Csa5